jgi:hypothetical protein
MCSICARSAKKASGSLKPTFPQKNRTVSRGNHVSRETTFIMYAKHPCKQHLLLACSPNSTASFAGAHTSRRARTRLCFGTSHARRWRTKLRQRHGPCYGRVAKADESAKSTVETLVCGERDNRDAAGQNRIHEYPPPKKFPVGGKAAIGLTRLLGAPLVSWKDQIPGKSSGREPMHLASRTHPQTGQDNQLMRIVPYESAAVKVRVQARVAKLGHFRRVRAA